MLLLLDKTFRELALPSSDFGRKMKQDTRVLQKVLSLGSDYFSATFYLNIFLLQTFKVFPPLLKHIFVTVLPSREKQINSLLLVSVGDTDSWRCQENFCRRILISRKHFLRLWK